MLFHGVGLEGAYLIELDPHRDERGFAQGYHPLCDEAEICYHTSARYALASAARVHWDDSPFGIIWPEAACTLSEQERTWPDLDTRVPPFPVTTDLQ
jgi:dTDP-4-dehydrorhamnose 3,5-epimerase-like enzyme